MWIAHGFMQCKERTLSYDGSPHTARESIDISGTSEQSSSPVEYMAYSHGDVNFGTDTLISPAPKATKYEQSKIE